MVWKDRQSRSRTKIELRPWKCGVSEKCWEFHGGSTGQTSLSLKNLMWKENSWPKWSSYSYSTLVMLQGTASTDWSRRKYGRNTLSRQTKKTMAQRHRRLDGVQVHSAKDVSGQWAMEEEDTGMVSCCRQPSEEEGRLEIERERERLSWLPVSFLLHVKYTLSYRIIFRKLCNLLVMYVTLSPTVAKCPVYLSALNVSLQWRRYINRLPYLLPPYLNKSASTCASAAMFEQKFAHFSFLRSIDNII